MFTYSHTESGARLVASNDLLVSASLQSWGYWKLQPCPAFDTDVWIQTEVLMPTQQALLPSEPSPALMPILKENIDY